MTKNTALVSTEWLADHLNDPALRIVDASWYLPALNRDGAAEYKTAHIPGALFWDIDKIADTESGLPHTMPSAEQFSREMSAMGIGNEHQVVIYDGLGLFSAARPWWMLRSFGHDNVAILDGGLPKWKAENRPLTSDIPDFEPAHFKARYRDSMMCDAGAVLKNLETFEKQILDARAAGRFSGDEPEPRPNSRSGHIPGSLNLPFNLLLDSEDQTVLSAVQLQQKFADAGIEFEKPVITSCGSGVTACILALGLHLIGKDDVTVYDGSWSEWGTREDTPVETG